MYEQIMTIEEARKCKYGTTSAREAYREGGCVIGLWHGWSNRQCSRKNGHGPDGLFCKQHDPIAQQEKVARKIAEFRRADEHRQAIEKYKERLQAAQEAAVEALKTTPCYHLLKQGVPVDQASANGVNCEPCTCWRKCLDDLPEKIT